MMPPMPKIRSNTTITSSNSHALDSISEPIIFAFKKYSSLCTTTKNTSEAAATYSDAPKLKIIITVLDTRLPATGTSPSHPDFYELTPEIPEGETIGRKLLQIKIDAVRGLIEHIQLTSVRGGKRVVLIHPAESMNTQAANGLLKILEEPSVDVVFLLVSHDRDRLLPTIKSRCRQMVLSAPDRQTALEYVRQQHPAHAEELLALRDRKSVV